MILPKKLVRQTMVASPVGHGPNVSSTAIFSSQNAGASYGSATGLAQTNKGTGDVNEDEDDWFRGDRPTTNRQIWDSAYAVIH